ncbi:MAG: amino acid ABC transporter permease [Spirochaetales bacterium]|nr:amino acid ABC transporter permease [Spirochaetales bacterium]
MKRKTAAALRQALFGTPRGTITTILVGVPTLLAVFSMLRFTFVRANWRIITDNQRLFYLGTYPAGSEWRVWIPLCMIAAVGGLTYGYSGGSLRRLFRNVAVAAVLLLGLGFDFVPRWINAFSFGLALPFGASWGMTLAVLCLIVVSATVARFKLRHALPTGAMSIALAVLWLTPILAALLLHATMSPNRWNGLFLDVMVFSVGALLSFPIGVLLALGRNSEIPSLRWATTAYIEIVRAAPLVVWLILALFLWEDFFVATNRVHRGMLVFGFFGAAYVAEVIRGGLQSIPRGQYEASRSLGLGVVATHVHVILPQAIRAVIPSLVGRFIALWKDTSLLLGLSLINTLEVATAILEGRPSNGQFLLEIYLIIALFYWIMSFSLSRLGARLETSYNRAH